MASRRNQPRAAKRPVKPLLNRQSRARYTFVAVGAVAFGGALIWLAMNASDLIQPTARNSKNASPASEPIPLPAIAASPASIHFSEVAADTGLRFHHTAGHSDSYLAPEILGPGVTIFDADGDGRDDVLFANGNSDLAGPGKDKQKTTSRLFRNVGGRFTDLTKDSGIGLDAYAVSAIAFDIDGDGDRDVIFATTAGLRAFTNDGHGRFREETRSRGLAITGWTSVLAPLDLDDDGDLDLFVGRYFDWSGARDAKLDCRPDGAHRDYCGPGMYAGTTPVILLNDGRGHFTDASERSNLPRGATKALGVLTVDLDGDGRMDVIVANDEVRTQVFLNRGDGTLTDDAVALGFAGTEGGSAFSGMGIDGTFQSPGGDFTLAIGTFYGEPIAAYARAALGRPFLARGTPLGLRQPSLPFVKFGLRFFDADADGLDDLLVANGAITHEERTNGVAFRQPMQVFAGTPSRFVEVSKNALGALAEKRFLGRAVATLDFDGDGDLDAVVTENDGDALLLENRSERRGHFIGLRLIGEPPNGDAIGARIEVTTQARSFQSWVHATGSYWSQSSLERIIGLGESEKIVYVAVDWPSGRHQIEHGLSVDQMHSIREDVTLAKMARPLPVRAGEGRRAELVEAIHSNHWKEALPILEEEAARSPDEIELQRDLALAYANDHQSQRALDAATLAAERAADANAIIRTLVIPWLDQHRPELARAALERAVTVLREPSNEVWTSLGVLRAGAGQGEAAESAFRKALSLQPLDARAAAHLAIQLNDSNRAPEAIALLAPFFPDRDHDPLLQRAFGIANYRMGNKSQAERAFEAAVAADPSDARSHYNLGQLAIEAHQFARAAEHLRKATALDGSDFRAWGNLGFAEKNLGHVEAARAAFLRVLELKPEDPQALSALQQLGQSPGQ